MIIDVHMLAFMEKGSIRRVEIPDPEMEGLSVEDGLEKVFYYGQNDFAISESLEDQRKTRPSVSVGDVIEYSTGEYWMVAPAGFKKITKEQFDSLEGHLSQNVEIFKELYTS